MVPKVWVNFSSGNGLVPDGTKPLPEPLFTYYQWVLWQSHETIFRRNHDDVIKWKHFPRYWPFVRGIHRSPVNCPHKGQWRINGWVNKREAGDLRRHRGHYDVIVMTDINLYDEFENLTFKITAAYPKYPMKFHVHATEYMGSQQAQLCHMVTWWPSYTVQCR